MSRGGGGGGGSKVKEPCTRKGRDEGGEGTKTESRRKRKGQILGKAPRLLEETEEGPIDGLEERRRGRRGR